MTFFSNVWTVKSGFRGKNNEPVVILENAMQDSSHRLIFSVDEAAWIGKELTKTAKIQKTAKGFIGKVEK